MPEWVILRESGHAIVNLRQVEENEQYVVGGGKLPSPVAILRSDVCRIEARRVDGASLPDNTTPGLARRTADRMSATFRGGKCVLAYILYWTLLEQAPQEIVLKLEHNGLHVAEAAGCGGTGFDWSLAVSIETIGEEMKESVW